MKPLFNSVIQSCLLHKLCQQIIVSTLFVPADCRLIDVFSLRSTLEDWQLNTHQKMLIFMPAVFLHVLFWNSLMLCLLLPCAPFHSPFFSCSPTSFFLSHQTLFEFLLLSNFSHSSSHFPISLPGSSNFYFSTPLHLPLPRLSQAASSSLLSSYTIISSSSCTCRGCTLFNSRA